MNSEGLFIPPEFESVNKIMPTAMEAASQLADQLAADAVFADYVSRKSTNTLRGQKSDLTRFANYLSRVGVEGYDALALQNVPVSWRGVSWGIVEGFVKWQLTQGYAVASVNRALSTVKTYTKLAAKAGVIEAQNLALICTVSGYGQKEAMRVNERRPVTRVGWKKSQNNLITRTQAGQLKTSDATPQGLRDTFMMCLLLDHGLRVGEVKLLTVGNFNLSAGEMTFFRPKVSRTQTHQLTDATMDALGNYLPHAPAEGRILRGSRKDKSLYGLMSETAITVRVSVLGKRLGMSQLSAHDCRHYWATTAARNGTPLERLQDAGGWASLAMPLRYIEAAKIANEGVVLDSPSIDDDAAAADAQTKYRIKKL